MEPLKTANTPRHNYSKNLKRYLVTRSTRSIETILRTKRIDAGFFFLEFYPLLRDMFLVKHKALSEKDFEILLQLHANQPFIIDDFFDCTLKKKDFLDDDWKKKTGLGIRTMKSAIERYKHLGIIEVFKKNGRYNKMMYKFTYKYEVEFRRIYEYMLCVAKIRTMDNNVVVPILKKSKTHYKKLIKQNNYHEAFATDINSELKTTDNEFCVKLIDARAKSRL